MVLVQVRIRVHENLSENPTYNAILGFRVYFVVAVTAPLPLYIICGVVYRIASSLALLYYGRRRRLYLPTPLVFSIIVDPARALIEIDTRLTGDNNIIIKHTHLRYLNQP